VKQGMLESEWEGFRFVIRASRSTVGGGNKVKAWLILWRASGNGVRVAALSYQTSVFNVLPCSVSISSFTTVARSASNFI
jgi:hypothetical protein